MAKWIISSFFLYSLSQIAFASNFSKGFGAKDVNGYNLTGCVDCFNFVAPSIAGAENVSPAEIGLMVFDTDSTLFRGATATGWQDLGDSLNAAAGSSSITLESTDETINRFNPTSADIVVTLGNSYPVVRIITIRNYGTKKISVKADNASGIAPVFPGGMLRFMANVGAPSTPSNWDVIGTILSDWASFTPTVNNHSSYTQSGFRWRRNGANLEIHGIFTATATGASGTFSIDTPSDVGSVTFLTSIAGHANTYIVGGDGGFSVAGIQAVSGSQFRVFDNGSGSAVTGTALPNTAMIEFAIDVPISGWTMNTGL